MQRGSVDVSVNEVVTRARRRRCGANPGHNVQNASFAKGRTSVRAFCLPHVCAAITYVLYQPSQTQHSVMLAAVWVLVVVMVGGGSISRLHNTFCRDKQPSRQIQHR